jgi:hypothetical protein
MASLVVHRLARSRGTLGGVGTPRELTDGAPCLGLAAVARAGVSAVVLLLA